MDSITALIDHSCSRFCAKDAILHKSGGGWQKTSYGTLGSVSGWIAAGLTQNGFRACSHAALLLSASARLAPYKRVKDFIVSQEAFPKITTRKIKRFEVENNLLKSSLSPHSTLNP